MRLRNDNGAVPFYVASGHTDDVIDMMTSQKELDDALLIAQSASEGMMPLKPIVTSHMNGDGDKDDEKQTDR